MKLCELGFVGLKDLHDYCAHEFVLTSNRHPERRVGGAVGRRICDPINFDARNDGSMLGW